MMIIKRLNIPKDIPLLLKVPFKVRKWRRKVKKEGFNSILLKYNNPGFISIPGEAELKKLERLHSITTAYLKKIVHEANPCIITSLVLFERCIGKGYGAKLIVGADKESGSIIGHSWVEIADKAVNENDQALNKYTRMMEI